MSERPILSEKALAELYARLDEGKASQRAVAFHEDVVRDLLAEIVRLRAATVSAGRLREAELRTAATSALLAVRHAYRMARKDNADAATMPTEQALAICERLRAALSAEEG